MRSGAAAGCHAWAPKEVGVPCRCGVADPGPLPAQSRRTHATGRAFRSRRPYTV